MKNWNWKKLKWFGISFFALALPTSIITPSFLLNQNQTESNKILNKESSLSLRSYSNPIDTINETFDKLVPYIANQLNSNLRDTFLQKVEQEKTKLLHFYSKKQNQQDFVLLNQSYNYSQLNNVKLSLINLRSQLEQLTALLGGITAIFSAAGIAVGVATLGIGSVPFALASGAIAGLATAVGLTIPSINAALESINTISFFNPSDSINKLNQLNDSLNNASLHLQNAMSLNWLVPNISKAKKIVDAAKPEVQKAIQELQNFR